MGTFGRLVFCIVRTQIVGKTKFFDSLRRTSCDVRLCVFARLQLRHICIYERHIGFAYRINRFGHMLDTVLPR